VISWTNEEGARFSPAMVGSGVWAGEFGIDYGHSRVDKAGITLKEALVDIGYLGELPAACNQPVKAAFELHIEQGPILENEDQQIGIVSGVQGMNWYDITIIGEACHAGPSPMEIRKDPFMALAPVIDRLYGLAKENAPWSRVTFGDISANPGSRNTVPESVTITMDLRHPNQGVLDDIDQQMRTIVAEECAKKGLEYVIHDEWKSPAVVFNEACVEAVTQATELLGYSAKNMVSGAGHDSVYVSRVAPTSMIFVPCDNGISHNEAENISSSQAVEGCNVLLHAMLQSAC
jgi:beta-ureidopropionase / N-carbamoyl-L-amino-acid hydrolase